MAASEPLVGGDLGKLRRTPVRDMLIRFAFGVGISTVSAVVGLTVGPAAGGLLLAFPAILPATLTLLEKEEGEHSAHDDDNGALLGAVALIGFAALAWQLFPRWGAPVAIPAATFAWLVLAVALYLASCGAERLAGGRTRRR